MRRALDTLYRAACRRGSLSGRDRVVGRPAVGRGMPAHGALALLHLPRTDFVILPLNEICGYLLAAASLLALAGTLKTGAQYRVTMVLAALSERTVFRRALGVRFLRDTAPLI